MASGKWLAALSQSDLAEALTVVILKVVWIQKAITVYVKS
jgi:hypothetical protein